MGQTALSSSYGLLQMLYSTAVDKFNFTFGDNGIGRAPHLLFTAPTSLDLGTEFVASKFPNADPVSIADFEKLKGDFKASFRKYNRDPQYPTKVLNRVSGFLPQ